MNYYSILPILHMLPDAHTVGTVSQELHPDEVAARAETLDTVLNATIDEAEALRKTGDNQGFLTALAEAWQYLSTLDERRHREDKIGGYSYGTDLQHGSNAAMQRLMAATNGNTQLIPDDEEPGNEQEQNRQRNLTAETHGTAAYIIGTARGLREHIRGLAAQGPLITGHALAALGFNMTLTRLTDELAELHEEECHHCDVVDRAYEASETALRMLHAVRLNIPAAIQTVLSPSIAADREATAEANRLIADTLDKLGNYQISLNGNPFDPYQSIHCYFIKGVLYTTRLSEPFPKGTSIIEASAMARNYAASALAHAEEHSAGSADMITERSEQVLAEAEQLLHNVEDAEIDTILEDIARITGDAITQARAILALIGDTEIAQRHMRRHPDLFPAATPEQAAEVTKALQRVQVHPPLAELIGNLLRHGAAALNGPADTPDTATLISLLEAASRISREDTERLYDVTLAMGAPAHRNPDIEDWLELYSNDPGHIPTIPADDEGTP